MDFFLNRIKHFYIPALRYWRYERLPGYERIFSEIDPGDVHQRDRLFWILKETFRWNPGAGRIFGEIRGA